jgi:hypothetical protein
VQSGLKALERMICLDQREEYIHFVRIVKNNKNGGKERQNERQIQRRGRERKKARMINK